MRNRSSILGYLVLGSLLATAGPSFGAPKKTKKKAAPQETAAPASPSAPPTAAATTSSAQGAANAGGSAAAPPPPVYTATTATPEAASSESGSSHPMPPPFTLEKISVSAGIAYGSNNLNFGLGARGGYTITQKVYVGALLDYWFGTSEEVSVPGTNIRSSSSVHFWDLLANAGYDFGITPNIVVRPFAGLGLVHAGGETCVGDVVAGQLCANQSTTRGAGLLGAQGLMQFGNLNAGAELRLLIETDSAVILALHAGATF